MGFLFGSNKSSSEKINRKSLEKSFATEVNRAVMTSITTDQTFSARDMIIEGNNNTVTAAQVATITAEQFVSQMSNIVDKVKSTLTSQLESSLQGDNSSGDSVTASGTGTPAGGSASGTMGGMVSTASVSAKTTNEVKAYLSMATRLSERIKSDESIKQMFSIRDLKIKGDSNNVNLTQSGHISKIQKIVQQVDKETDEATELESTLTTTTTMTSSGNAAIASGQMTGALVAIAAAFFIFGGGSGGGENAQARSARFVQECGGAQDKQCIQRKHEDHKTSQNTKFALKVFGIIVLVIMIAYAVFRSTKFMRNLF